MLPDDGLDHRIRNLRDHLERGGLRELPPFDLGHGTGHFPGETTVRIMLADHQDLDDPTGSAAGDPAWRRERLRELLG